MPYLKSLLVLAIISTCCSGSAQILKPAKWTFELSSNNPKAGDEIDVIFKAHIAEKWYMYSSDFDSLCGPIVASVKFTDIKNFKLVGELKSINSIDKYEEVFGCSVKIFKKDAEFRQRIKVLGGPMSITGSIEGQVCTTVDGSCTSFDEDFSFTNVAVTGKAIVDEKKSNGKAVVEPSTNETLPKITVDSAKSIKTATKTYGENTGPHLDPKLVDEDSYAMKSSIWGYMILAFVLGLTSIITPCVFPMLPMTVTFFLKEGQTKRQGVNKALFFGVSIIVIYTIAGTLFAIFLGPEGLNALATHWFPNLLIFFLFLFFALSFLGLYEINAPNALVNKADKAADKGGIIGIFFMSATLVLVSFSCTIPLVGNVLVLSAGGQVVKPILGMFAYSLAFAIPFTIFAMFPEWLKQLPKSGGWLNAVKVTLGLLEIALALKFFSIADQTYHWGLLDRDINIAIWVVIFTLLGVYFLGKLRLKSDSPVESVSVPRLLLAIATFSFVIYLIPGLWGAPLKALAGYLPPMYTHDFNLFAANKSGAVCEEPKYEDFLHLPHGLNGYYDYDQAIACARQQNKPLFIDFTGHGCTNCREMEAAVWSDPQVLRRLQNDFVVVALYVDDKTELPESEWYTSTYDKKVKKTIGKQNADLQITNLENNAQPFYVLLGLDEVAVAPPYGYKKDPASFVKFLDDGTKRFKEKFGN